MSVTDNDLIDRLGRLGDDIDREIGDDARLHDRDHDPGLDRDDERVHDRDLVQRVLAAIGPVPSHRSRRWWAAAAALLLVVVAGVLLMPDSRAAVARWFGLDGVFIEIEPSLSIRAADGLAGTVGPGDSRIVEVDGREILVSAIGGAFDERLITKTIGSSEQIQQVTVNGAPGLWIADAPHEVLYDVREADASESVVVVERVAANTLLWNDGEVLYRVEGFDRLEDALDYAESVVASNDPEG